MTDLAKRFPQNPILKPTDVRPSIPGMKVECLLNPGVFRFQNRTWLLLRVAERPEQKPGKTSFPILGPEGKLHVLSDSSSDKYVFVTSHTVSGYGLAVSTKWAAGNSL